MDTIHGAAIYIDYEELLDKFMEYYFHNTLKTSLAHLWPQRAVV
jgi:hypothetical protein